MRAFETWNNRIKIRNKFQVYKPNFVFLVTYQLCDNCKPTNILSNNHKKLNLIIRLVLGPSSFWWVLTFRPLIACPILQTALHCLSTTPMKVQVTVMVIHHISRDGIDDICEMQFHSLSPLIISFIHYLCALLFELEFLNLIIYNMCHYYFIL